MKALMEAKINKSYRTLEIIPMEVREIEQVLAIACESGLSFWSFADYKKEIDIFDGFIKVARINGETIGFIVARPSFEEKSNILGNSNESNGNIKDNGGGSEIELEIYNIAVKKNFRRKGIGQRLLQNLLSRAVLYRRAVLWLEVRQSNVEAINFYRANNFKIALQRKDFYRRPTEDAFVMKLEIGSA